MALLYLLPAAQVARVPAARSASSSPAGPRTSWPRRLAALLAALLGPDPSLLGALQAAGTGAGYGFFTGWIIGIASLGGRA